MAIPRLYPERFDPQTAFAVGDDVSFCLGAVAWKGRIATITPEHFTLHESDGLTRIFWKELDYDRITHLVCINGRAPTFAKEKPRAPSSGHSAGTKVDSFSKPSSLGI